MRVLHVDPERGWGGGEVQVLGLCERQLGNGVDVRLAADPGGRLIREARTRGIPTVELAVRNHLDLKAGWRLRRLARDTDVVHFHTARAHALAPWVGGLGLRRVVTRRMDYPPRGPATRFLYERAVDVVIAISEGVREALTTAGIDRRRIVVVHSGIDLDRIARGSEDRLRQRHALGVPEETPLILGVGTLERRKGFDVLIDAVARCGPGLRVVLAGDGAEREALEHQAAAAGVALTCLGFQDSVSALLAAADVVAAPSRAEGLGIAVLEAMAAGTAVVASAVGGLREVVIDEHTGLLVPPGDVDHLARALMRLAADGALRARLGEAARRDVRRRFSMDAMAAGTRACYEHAP